MNLRLRDKVVSLCVSWHAFFLIYTYLRHRTIRIDHRTIEDFIWMVWYVSLFYEKSYDNHTIFIGFHWLFPQSKNCIKNKMKFKERLILYFILTIDFNCDTELLDKDVSKNLQSSVAKTVWDGRRAWNICRWLVERSRISRLSVHLT